MLRPIGVMLAGGASSRMGTDKATVEVAGRPMSAWVLDALSAVCEDVLPSVVYERHYALNWLIGYCDQSWDEVTTDT